MCPAAVLMFSTLGGGNHVTLVFNGTAAYQNFPVGKALMGRPASEFTEHTRQAWQIKLGHARAVTNRHPAWLRGFVDDDQDIVRKLAGCGVPAHEAGTLAQLGVASLRGRLDKP